MSPIQPSRAIILNDGLDRTGVVGGLEYAASVSTLIPLIPGLYTALTTPLGTFLNADRVRRECQDSWNGVFVHPVGTDGAVLARVVGGTPEGGRYAGEIARMPPPERLESAVDALRYAERISERITAEGWDVSLSLAVLRAQANGIAGWIGGGVQVWSLQDDNHVVPCSPPQTLQLPPGMSIGLDPSTLVQSGVARGFATGEWFEATGQRFAIVLCKLTRSLLTEYCQAFSRCVPQRFTHPSLIEAQPATQALTMGLLARCCGLPFADELDAASWLEVLARDNSRTESSFELGLLTLAYGHPEHLPRIIFGTTPAFEPGLRFGFNTQGFTHYLAAAMNTGAELDDVAPAWREFLAAFPHKLAAQTLSWSGLLAAAYVVHHRIQGRPEKHVADVLASSLRN